VKSKSIPGRSVTSHEKKEKTMVTVGALARFEARSGKEADVEHFFQGGLPIVQRQPASTVWYAFRLGPTTFGAFAAFANEEERHALLSVGGPVLAERYSDLFAQPPTFQKVDILAAKLPRGENGVAVGSLVRFEARSGKEAAWERFLKEVLGAVQEAPGTTAWFAFRLGPTTSGVFDTFPDEAGRQAHFQAGVARAEKASDLLEMPPAVEKVDIFASRLPG
jgi:quinol monooxygenase YgiN